MFVSSYIFRGGGGIDIYKFFVFVNFFVGEGGKKMLSRGCVIFPHILNGLGYFFAYFLLLS